MKDFMKGIGMAVIMLSLAAGVSAQDKKPQTTCPVMGGKIDKNVYTDFQGQRIYFCCPECVATFKADPERYMEKFDKEGVLLESVQKKCPVMGGKINKDIYVDYKGRRVYFCCAACPDKFKADPDKYLKKLEEQTGSKDEGQAGTHEGHSGGKMKMKMKKKCGGRG